MANKSITKEEAQTYQWWSSFLEARTNAITAMLVLGKSKEEILYTLSFNDMDHLKRIIKINKLEESSDG